VNLLLDTHAYLWSIAGAGLSDQARRAYLDPENRLYLSAVSYWEICLKVNIGKLILADGWAQQFDGEILANGIQWLPIERKHCQQLTNLPLLHQDPFDRLLIAQALCEEMTLLTANRHIQQYPVATLW
jgi:PIN domain nuclease of toxin-antitoxin system